MPVKPIDEIFGFELKLLKKYYYFYGPETPHNSSTSARLAQGKYFTNRVLQKAGIPVPNAALLGKEEFAQKKLSRVLAQLNFPLVIKPLDKSEGTGVLCNIQSPEELEAAVTQHFLSYNVVVIEEFHGHLNSYRVLVFNNRIIGIVLRKPSQVIGNGKHKIKELIDTANIERKAINPYLGLITLDQEMHIRLNELNISADYVPGDGEVIVLNYTSNASRGGTFETVARRISKQNSKLMKRTARVLGLKLVGIDVQCDNLSTPIENTRAVILEANQVPSIRIHELPMQGRPQMVTRKIMRSFIYRHPFAYLYSLYCNNHTRFYVRCFIVALITATLYPLIALGII